MKKLKLIARFRALPIKTRQIFTLGIIFALVIALPLFIWAILTQRFDIRKRATGEPPPTPTWEPPPSPSPEVKRPIDWKTSTVSLKADDFYILIDGTKKFYPKGAIGVQSDPGNPKYTTLEVSWYQDGIDMRLNIYFHSDGGTWWSPELRTYDGEPRGEWIYYYGKYFESRIGESYLASSVDITSLDSSPEPKSTAQGGFGSLFTTPSPWPTPREIHSGLIHFENLRLQAFTNISPIPKPIPMKFKIKFAGVADDLADGAKAKIRFVKDGVDLETSPIIFSHAGNGVYEASITLGSSLPEGSGYTIYVKGEKHLARKFCVVAGQSERCVGNGRIVIPSFVFDFTGLELEPGDLYPQDGKADSEDFAKIISLLSKLCSDLTEQDRFVADLDYNGCVNIRDAFLMRKTLETKYDE